MYLSPSSPIRFGCCALCTDVCSELSPILTTGCTGNVMAGTCMGGCIDFTLGVVLLIPWQGLFICPFAVAGLGLKYLSINFLLMFGHPLKNPFRTAFNSVEIFGLHNNSCVNFTAFTHILMEWVNPAIDWCGA
jgi:hypothetical protein